MGRPLVFSAETKIWIVLSVPSGEITVAGRPVRRRSPSSRLADGRPTSLFFDKALPKLPSKIVLKTIIRYSKSFFVCNKAFLGGLSLKYVRYIEFFGV